MTAFSIPTVVTARLRLRAFRAGDLDAFAAMRANPEVVRYLGTGRPATRIDVWRMMAGFLGQFLPHTHYQRSHAAIMAQLLYP